MKRNNVFAIALFGLLMACAAPGTEDESTASDDAATTEVDDTETVVNRHLAAFSANDIEAIMADYAEDARIIDADSTYVGKEAIRGAQEGFFKIFPAGQFDLVMERMAISGDIAYIAWHATTPTVNIKFGTDTFVIRDGKIVCQTFGAVREPVEGEEGQ